MRIYLQWPKSGIIGKLFPAFIGVTIFFGLIVLEESLRQERDLKDANEICGVISKYTYDVKRVKGSLNTWRLFVTSEQGNREIFDVGQPYLHSMLQKQNMEKGRNICVQYIPQFFHFGDEFISQILLERTAILKPVKVVEIYLDSPGSLLINIVIIAFLLTCISIIKVEK
jgi:hypothetical protein